MKIELTIDGGFAAFPGLAKPLVLDAEDLAPELKAQMHRLVATALEESRGAQSAAGKAVPDGRRYCLDIHGESGKSRIGAADPAVPPAFAALMAFAQANGKR